MLDKRSKADFTFGNKQFFTNISEGTAFLLQGLLAQGMLDDFMAAIF